jgi:hypothetical protein
MEIAGFPAFFPVNREFAVETGSHMTAHTTRKIESNTRNASRSTDPRTMAGKLCSRKNALRHGLAAPIEQSDGIDDLAAILAEGDEGCCRTQQSRVIAECHFDLQRIQAARYDVLLMVENFDIGNSVDLERALVAMEKINRYETSTLSKRRRVLKPLFAISAGRLPF